MYLEAFARWPQVTTFAVAVCVHKTLPIHEWLGLATGKLEDAKSLATGKLEDAKSLATGKLEGAKSLATGKLEDAKGLATGKLEDAKSLATGKLEDAKSLATGKLEDAKSLATGKLEDANAQAMKNVAMILPGSQKEHLNQMTKCSCIKDSYKGICQCADDWRTWWWSWHSDGGDKSWKVHVTGHSLGGALATVCGVDLAHTLPEVCSHALTCYCLLGKSACLHHQTLALALQFRLSQ